MSLRQHRRFTAAAVLALPLGFLAGGAGPASAASATVAIKGYAFGPAQLTVNVGDTVTWTNKDTAAHDVTSSGPGPLRSPRMTTGQTYSASFPSAGTFHYVCTIHPDMTATVTVKAALTTTTDAAAAPTTAAVAAPTTTVAVSPAVVPAGVNAVAVSSDAGSDGVNPLLFLAAAVAAVVVGGTIAVLEPRRRQR